MRRHVEGFEIVPVVFHFGAFGHLEAHGNEYVFQFLAHLGHEVKVAPGYRPAALGQRPVPAGKQPGGLAQVEALGAGLAGPSRRLELGQALADNCSRLARASWRDWPKRRAAAPA